MAKGWKREPARHALASRGVKTKVKKRGLLKYDDVAREYFEPEKGKHPYADYDEDEIKVYVSELSSNDLMYALFDCVDNIESEATAYLGHEDDLEELKEDMCTIMDELSLRMRQKKL